MTSEVILYLLQNERLHNVSNHRHFYQTQFINEKSLANIPQSHSFLLDIEELTLLIIC